MPYLDFQKRESLSFDNETILHLTVPAEYSTVFVREKKDRKRNPFAIRWWDCSAQKLKTKMTDAAHKKQMIEDIEKSTANQNYSKEIMGIDLITNINFFTKFYRWNLVCSDYPHQDLPLPAYIIGVWLGDGTTSRPQITSVDQPIINSIYETAELFDLHVLKTKITYSLTTSSKKNLERLKSVKTVQSALSKIHEDKISLVEVARKYNISTSALRKYVNIFDKDGLSGIEGYYNQFTTNRFIDGLRKLSIYDNKHVPLACIQNSRETRQSLLAGIIDTDGSLADGGYDMCFKSENMMISVLKLAESLGFLTSKIKKCKKTCTNTIPLKICDAYRARIYGSPELIQLPIKLSHKKITKNNKQRFDQLRFTVRSE